MTVRLDIPEKGRTCIGALYKLADVGLVDVGIARGIETILIEDKKRIKGEAKSGNYSDNEELTNYIKTHPLAKYVHLQPDTGRCDYPPRIVFNMCKSVSPEGTQLLIKGISHYNAPQELRSHNADIILCGWDEFYASMLYELDKKGRHIGKWPNFNTYREKESQALDDIIIMDYVRTDAQIAGSAGLNDFVGHWLVFPKGKIPELIDESGRVSLEGVGKIYIDPKYEGIYKEILSNYITAYGIAQNNRIETSGDIATKIMDDFSELIDPRLRGLYEKILRNQINTYTLPKDKQPDIYIDSPQGLRPELIECFSGVPEISFSPHQKIEFISADDVEDAVLANDGVGFEVVQTASTLKNKGLAMVGLPIVESETIIAHATLNEEGSKILELLNPSDYHSKERVRKYGDWYSTISNNAGSSWLSRPTEERMFWDKWVNIMKLPVAIPEAYQTDA